MNEITLQNLSASLTFGASIDGDRYGDVSCRDIPRKSVADTYSLIQISTLLRTQESKMHRERMRISIVNVDQIKVNTSARLFVRK